MSRRPTRLFSTAPMVRAFDNAHVGGVWSSSYVYVNAYYHGAVVMTEAALSGGGQDLLFYPICFNFRHCTELHLKALVPTIEALHGASVELGEDVAALPSMPQKMMDRHSLLSLLQWIKESLNVFNDEEFDVDVEHAIADLHKHDSDGQSFRYHTKADGSISLPDEVRVDLRSLLEQMERTHYYLSGADMWLEEHLSTARAMISDLTPEW